jgi:hypothetical protein
MVQALRYLDRRIRTDGGMPDDVRTEMKAWADRQARIWTSAARAIQAYEFPRAERSVTPITWAEPA